MHQHRTWYRMSVTRQRRTQRLDPAGLRIAVSGIRLVRAWSRRRIRSRRSRIRRWCTRFRRWRYARWWWAPLTAHLEQFSDTVMERRVTTGM
ncbi:hypothetical protein DIQ79_16440 [Mycolicibacterium smegmatis]|uniref:Uncharacterized protein n=1 Tax=Mycolicibacterium smegmatis (strain ATCC 700084 / mc(2)155) TaxID=246196 RepID=A0R306_MYCS2|nr:hypothetical protein MSMEG_5299 [Mycolicibacterium smegmatis MC2 155]TBM50299.1 hypothetical protein DIQ85_15385 [Mycolicibacterium smegmatis]TBH45162.1 hypothetical protein EYS45_14190 [Mycolicibacterium smegmatis MC2 155]TBM50938.1 hypothetical protein DIQ86_06900 [Mycolicibacterium smegmatis]TBM61386.1 hypothetical protein DIQ83_15445 [Mycolicibacterium smegmatis]